MCDPATIAAIVTAGAALFGVASAPAPTPPPAETPALPAPPARASGATVRLGIGQEDLTTKTEAPTTNFVEKRASANSLGNLGRSGLTI